MDAMKRKYQEEFKALHIKNVLIRQNRGMKELVPSTLTQPEPTKSSWPKSTDSRKQIS